MDTGFAGDPGTDKSKPATFQEGGTVPSPVSTKEFIMKKFIEARGAQPQRRDPATVAAENMWFRQASHIKNYGVPRGYRGFHKWLAMKDRQEEPVRKEVENGNG